VDIDIREELKNKITTKFAANAGFVTATLSRYAFSKNG